MGISFKENISDIRNSKSLDLYFKFKDINVLIDIFDPYVNDNDINEINIKNNFDQLKKDYYDAIIITVPHDKIISLGIKKIREIGIKDCLIFDVKSCLPYEKNIFRL